VSCLLLLQVFACVVGQRPSKAMFYLNDVSEVVDLLGKMAGVALPPRADSFCGVFVQADDTANI